MQHYSPRIFSVSNFNVQLRFRTDPNSPGVEKLNVISPSNAWLDSKYKPLPCLDVEGCILSELKLAATVRVANLFFVMRAHGGAHIRSRPTTSIFCGICERLAA